MGRHVGGVSYDSASARWGHNSMNLEATTPQRDLEERLRFEMLIADLSSKFVNLPAGEVDREIMDAERRICELLDLDIMALWQLSDEAARFFSRHPFLQCPAWSAISRACYTRRIIPGSESNCWLAASLTFLRWRNCRRRPPATGNPSANWTSSRI